MPTISTESIEGFDSMTAEQKVEALLKVEVPDKVDLSGYIQKSQFDKVSSELAEAKKTLKGKLSEDEAAKAQADADRKALEDKYTELLRKSTIAEHTARYIAMPGYDEKLARELVEKRRQEAKEKEFSSYQKVTLDNLFEQIEEGETKELRADLVKQDPKPDGAGGGTEEKDEAVEFAKKLGKQRADALKNANEGLKHYF